MSFRGKLWILVISGVIAMYAVVGGLPFVGGLLSTSAQQPVSDANAQLRIFESVLQHIQKDYVDDPNMDKVRLGALRGLASGLDPYSSFLTAEQVQNFEANKLSDKVGIGAEFSQISGYLYVISAVKGSPAERAGIKPGDVIEYIGTSATRDISLYDAVQLVKGDAGTTIDLRVLRAGEKPQTLKVTRTPFKAPPVESRVEAGKIGVVKVYSLQDGEADNIKNQVENLKKEGIQKIVLDLRGVATGSITEGAAVANIFIKDGDIAKVIGRENKVLTTYTADPAKQIFDGELAVLIDLGTSGAGEVVAAAVLDRKRGEVIGERSFGSGTEQKLFPLSRGGGYLLTVAKWAGPNGTPFLGDDRMTSGVKPSIEVKRPDTPEPIAVENLVDQKDEKDAQATPTPTPKPVVKVSEDIQLKKALEVLQHQAMPAKAG